MKKILKLSIVSLIVMGIFTGCFKPSKGKGVPVEETTEVQTQEETQAEVQEETPSEIIIKHPKGETVVKTNPKKIAVFDMGVLDTLDTLGVNVELALPISTLPSYLKSYENAVNAGAVKEPNIEELFNFAPEIIFMGARQADFYDELSKIAPTVFIEMDSANYLSNLEYNVGYLAQIFGKEEEAKIELAKIKEKMEAVKAKAESSDEKALIILTNDGSVSAYGKGSRFGIIHDTLGINPVDENIEVSRHGKGVSYEYIAEMNPDILFVVDRNAVVAGEGNAEKALDNDLVKSTNAFKTGKIINLTPEAWYIVEGGLKAVNIMLDEVDSAL